jgi:methylated-DNA-[protein]-cysteine S-methyltransferase
MTAMTWALFETAIGEVGLAWSEAGLTWVQLPEVDPAATRARLLSKVRDATPMATGATLPRWVDDAMTSLRAHLAGEPQELALIPLDLSRVAPFTAKVFRAGQTTTYGELAKVAGSPGAARAVGQAMATNPWPVVVPCHRVVATGGGVGGFSAHGGLVTKEKLLRLEGGTLSAQRPLFD